MCTRFHCGKQSLFVEVALDINKTWPLCCCFISIAITAGLWSVMVAIFVSFGFERRKMYLWECLWREPGVGRTSWKKTYILKWEMNWNYLEPPVTRWTQQRPDTEKLEIHRRKLHMQYHCPIEYNIGNSYCHKEHHLKCLQVLEQNRNGSKVTQTLKIVKISLVMEAGKLNHINLTQWFTSWN